MLHTQTRYLKYAIVSIVLSFSLLSSDSFAQNDKSERQSIKTGDLTIKLNSDSHSTTQHATEKIPPIDVDSSNVRILDRKTEPESAQKKGEIIRKIATDSNSLAAKLANESSKTIIEWRPLLNANGSRGIRIPTVAISQDRSILVFAETTGAESGPNGTRIIAMNTYTWEPMKVFHVESKVVRAQFIPDSTKLAVILAEQEKLHQHNAVGIIDLESQKLESTYSLPTDYQFADICTSKDSIFVALKGRAEILAYKMTGNDHVPITMKCEEPASVLAITPNQLFLAGLSSKHMTLFKLSDCKKYSSVPMELPWNPANIQFIDSEKNYFLSPSVLQDASPILVRDGRKIPFDGRSGGFAIVTKDKKNIYVGYKVKGQIDCIDAVTADVLERTMLEQIRPPTIGDPNYVFFLDHRNFLFVLDTNGNAYVATHVKGENRWRKAVLFTAKK